MKLLNRMCATGLLVLLVAALVSLPRAEALAASPSSPAGLVNPFVGTGEEGNTFPGAVLPFGMVQFSPDTTEPDKHAVPPGRPNPFLPGAKPSPPGLANSGGGYRHADTHVLGFSLLHLSGAGAPQGDVPILPTTEPIKSSPVGLQSVTSSPLAQGTLSFATRYLPALSHRAESAEPGYYRAELDPGTPEAIGAQLSATTRSGIARFRFPHSSHATVLINATGSQLGSKTGSVEIQPGSREVTGSSTTAGSGNGSPNSYTVYFAARFDRPFKAYGTWVQKRLSPGSTSAFDPGGGTSLLPGANKLAQAGAYLTFDARSERVVEMRIGVSFVSIAGARANLEAESTGHSFKAIRSSAHQAWESMLRRVEVQGGAREDRRTFYTALYHALIHPSTFSDVDGSYMGMDHSVHGSAGTRYANFSGWDVYRNQIPLLALVAPKVASDFATSLVANQAESGWLPKWSMANAQTGVMTGDPADPTIAAIWALGAREFDAEAALAAMVKGATELGRSSVQTYVERQASESYQRLGFVPHEENGEFPEQVLEASEKALSHPWGSASTTIEYSTDDFSIARMAAAVGDRATCATFLARSGNWRNVFDASVGYPRARWANGRWVSKFDPNIADPFGTNGFAEGSPAAYTWQVPQDAAGLIAALGGRKAATRRLDAFFTSLDGGGEHARMSNETSNNAPWLYDWTGRPYKTQALVRRAIRVLYDDTPDGIPGNDDLGEMSAWYVFAAIGLDPSVPGTDVFALASPLFPTTTLRLAGGTVTIEAPKAAPGRPYVHRLTLDGQRLGRPWLRLAEIAQGATLRFDLRARPNKKWGSARSAAPPSYGPKDVASCSAG